MPVPQNQNASPSLSHDQPSQLKMEDNFEGESLPAPSFELSADKPLPPPEEGGGASPGDSSGEAPPPFQLNAEEASQANNPAPFKESSSNDTGLPDGLKSGVEQLSGFSMDDVQVNLNSSEPAQLNANAFARGNEIHVGPGQEKHLPEEAWHVAQQKAGKVQANTEVNGHPVNDQDHLESEAKSMGGKALQMKAAPSNELQSGSVPTPVAQRAIEQDGDEDNVFNDPENSDVPDLYYSKKTIGESPIFVNADFVDELVELTEGISAYQLEGVTDAIGGWFTQNSPKIGGRGGIGEEMVKPVQNLLAKYIANLFWTDKGNAVKYLQAKGNPFWIGKAINEAMAHPKLGGKGGGFSNRFPDGRGTIVTKLPIDFVLKVLGLKPGSIGPGSEIAFIHPDKVDKQILASFLADETPEINYTPDGQDLSILYYRKSLPGNLEGGEEVNPRKAKSKFMGAKVNAATYEEFAHGIGNPKSMDSSLLPGAPSTLGSGDWVDYRGKARRQGRGKGQFANMNNWNALGYAAYAVMLGILPESALSTDWEWLHIQGAGLGGPTNPNNLLAGTSSVNSAMIPWEDKIKEFSAKVTRSLGETFSVRFDGLNGGLPNLGKLIRLSVAAPKGIKKIGLAPISKSKPITKDFHPLSIGVFDDVLRHFSLSQEVIREPGTQLMLPGQMPPYMVSMLGPEMVSRMMGGNPMADLRLGMGQSFNFSGGMSGGSSGFAASSNGFSFGSGFNPDLFSVGSSGGFTAHGSSPGRVRGSFHNRRKMIGYYPPGLEGYDQKKRQRPMLLSSDQQKIVKIKRLLGRAIKNAISAGQLDEETLKMAQSVQSDLADGSRDTQFKDIVRMTDKSPEEIVQEIMRRPVVFYHRTFFVIL